MTRAFLLTMAIAVGLFAQKMQAEEHQTQVAQNQGGPAMTLGTLPIAGAPWPPKSARADVRPVRWGAIDLTAAPPNPQSRSHE